MTLDKAYDLLNFFINKVQGAYFTPAELDNLVDRAQHTLFNSYYTRYAVSQRLDDALNPFKVDFAFSLVTTPGGLLTAPSNYHNLLSISVTIVDSGNVTRVRPVQLVEEDDLANRLNSQVVPVTVNDPVAISKARWAFQLYPAQPMAGTMTYLRIPAAPFFSYSVISGRVIVYNAGSSVQLEWNDKDIVSILHIALDGLGINMSEQDIMAWSEKKIEMNQITMKQ